MAAGYEPDADARSQHDRQIRVFNETLDFNNPKDFPTTGTNLELPFVDLESRGDKNNWGPRAGLAWDLNDGRSVVRAGVRHLLQPEQHPDCRSGGQQPAAGQRRDCESVVSGPLRRSGPASGSCRRRRRTSRFWPMTSRTSSRTPIVPAFAGALAIGGHPCGRRLYQDDQGPDGVDINRRPATCRRRPARGPSSSGSTRYSRSARWTTKRCWCASRSGWINATCRVSYTLADSSGNLPWRRHDVHGDAGRAPQLDEGPSSSDRRHAIAASGSVLLPADITLSGVFSYRSTMPFSATAGWT